MYRYARFLKWVARRDMSWFNFELSHNQNEHMRYRLVALVTLIDVCQVVMESNSFFSHFPSIEKRIKQVVIDARDVSIPALCRTYPSKAVNEKIDLLYCHLLTMKIEAVHKQVAKGSLDVSVGEHIEEQLEPQYPSMFKQMCCSSEIDMESVSQNSTSNLNIGQ